MPPKFQKSLSITWKQAIAFRLKRHHLLERAPRRDLLKVVDDMTGAQAQLLPAAQLSLWARVQGLEIADVNTALQKRLLVKASAMRRTLFLLPSRQLAVFVCGSARRAQREITWARGKGVPDRVIEAAIDAALGVLDQPLTRPEIAERVSQVLGVQSQAVHGGGWGRRSKVAAVPVGHLVYPVVDLLHLVGRRGVVIYGPPRGNEPTFVRADAYIPRWKDLPPEQAEEALLRKYLRAYGPATPEDFAVWNGISFKEARAIWMRMESRMTPVNVDGWPAGALREDLDELAEAGSQEAPVRLLPYFDSFLLGHRERRHLVALEHHARVYRPQGWIAPVVLVDGRVAAVWQQERAGDGLLVKVTKLGALPRRAAAGIREEALDLARYLGVSRVEIQLG